MEKTDNYRIFISKEHLCFSRWSSGVPLFWSKLPIQNSLKTKKHNNSNGEPTAFVIVNFRKFAQNIKPNLLNWKSYFKLKENKEHSFQMKGKVKAGLNKLRQICRNGFLKYADWSKALKFIEMNIRKTFTFDFICEILLFSCDSLSQIGHGINRGKILRIQYTKNTLKIVSVEDQQFDFLQTSNYSNPNPTVETKSDLIQLNKHNNTEHICELSDWEYFSPIEINKSNYFFNQVCYNSKIVKSLFTFSGNILEIVQKDGMDKIVIDPFKIMETILKTQYSFIKSRCYQRTIPALTFTDNLTCNNTITKVVPKLDVHANDALVSRFRESITTKVKCWPLKCSNTLNNLNNITEKIAVVMPKRDKYVEIKTSILYQLQSLTMIKELTFNFCAPRQRQSLNNIKMLNKAAKTRYIDISADVLKNQISTVMCDDIEEQNQMTKYRESVPITELSLSGKNRYPQKKKQCNYIFDKNLSWPVKSLIYKNYELKSDEPQLSMENTSKTRNDFSLINELSLVEPQYSNANLYLTQNYFSLDMEPSPYEPHLSIGNTSKPRNYFNLDMELSPHEPYRSIKNTFKPRNDFSLISEVSLDEPQTSVKTKENLVDLSSKNVNDFRCCSQRLISIIKKDLYSEVFKRIRNYNIKELFLLITFDGHKNYHIGIGKLKHPRFINCLYATKRAIKEADKDNLFMEISTTFLSL